MRLLANKVRDVEPLAGPDGSHRAKEVGAMSTFQWAITGGFSAAVMALSFLVAFVVSADAQVRAAHAYA